MHVVDHSFNKNEATLINFRKYAEYPNLLHALCHKEYESLERPKSLAREKLQIIGPWFWSTWY